MRGVAALAEVLHLNAHWTKDDWMSAAVCAGNTELFFPPHGEQPDAREKREAIAITFCRQCPVLIPCRDYARENREQGFWGGENDDARQAARRSASRRQAV
jgi:WhiB family transcriptional regulator, redox-sensing transcriptional regulator